MYNRALRTRSTISGVEKDPISARRISEAKASSLADLSAIFRGAKRIMTVFAVFLITAAWRESAMVRMCLHAAGLYIYVAIKPDGDSRPARSAPPQGIALPPARRRADQYCIRARSILPMG